MKISGMNGGNYILSNMAKSRLEQGWFDGAYIKGKDNNFIVYFKGKDAEWKGDQLALSSSRNPYEPRVFKSIDGAVAELNRIGIMRLEVIIIDTDITTEK